MRCASRHHTYQVLCVDIQQSPLDLRAGIEGTLHPHEGAHLVGKGCVGRARGWRQAGGVRPRPGHGNQVQHQQLSHRPPRRVLPAKYVHTAAHQRRLCVARGTAHSKHSGQVACFMTWSSLLRLGCQSGVPARRMEDAGLHATLEKVIQDCY